MAGVGVQVLKADRHLGDLQTLTVTSGAGTSTSNSTIVTSESLSTAAAATYTLTLTNLHFRASSFVYAEAKLLGATTGTPYVTSITPATGSCVIVVTNIHASAALNGTISVLVSILA